MPPNRSTQTSAEKARSRLVQAACSTLRLCHAFVFPLALGFAFALTLALLTLVLARPIGMDNTIIPQDQATANATQKVAEPITFIAWAKPHKSIRDDSKIPILRRPPSTENSDDDVRVQFRHNRLNFLKKMLNCSTPSVTKFLEESSRKSRLGRLEPVVLCGPELNRGLEFLQHQLKRSFKVLKAKIMTPKTTLQILQSNFRVVHSLMDTPNIISCLGPSLLATLLTGNSRSS